MPNKVKKTMTGDFSIFMEEIKKIAANKNINPVKIPWKGGIFSGNNPTPNAHIPVRSYRLLGIILLYSFWKKKVQTIMLNPRIITERLKIGAVTPTPNELT